MSSGITIVCREVCRQTGAVTAYICKKDVEAVSYTHLDVYKRQALP